MAWHPAQTACALEEIAADMRVLIAKAERIDRNASPEWRDQIQASDFGQMPLHGFADDAANIAKAIFAKVEAREVA